MTATPGIPDGVSFSDLQALMANAQTEEQAQNPVPSDESFQDKVERIAEKHLQAAIDDLDDPMVHKLMVIQALCNFIDWHNHVAQSKFEEGEFDCGAAWLKDAGKFQACLNILFNVTVGPDDFTCNE